VRRLADALQRADAGDIVAAGALVIGLVEQERDGAAACRRVAALLDAILMAPGAVLAQDVRVLLEDAAEGLLQMRPATRPDHVARQVGILLREVAVRCAPPPAHRAVSPDVSGFLADHLHRGARLGDLARRLGYSASHCSWLVRRVTGERFSVLRRRMQLERAIGLLRSGTSVKEAALTAGFSEPAYFTRVFSRRFGVPPSRWREVLE
jgi:AraC-like DNA-binding protein